MSGKTARLRSAVLASIAIAAMALAGCATSAAPGGEPTPTDGALLGGTPSATTTATASAQPSSTSSTAAAPTYPKDAKSYSLELLKAWGQKDYNRLGQLAIQSAVQQIRDSVTFGGVPNTQWTYISCGPDTSNSTICIFRNAHGDQTAIKLTNTQLGFPTAVTEAPLERTVYPGDPVSYVSELFTAQSNGNQQRVLRLSNSTVKSKMSCTFGYSASTVAIDSTYTRVILNGLGVDLGKLYEFKVLSNPGGKAGAVKEVLAKSC
jgi:hypothetical protein